MVKKWVIPSAVFAVMTFGSVAFAHYSLAPDGAMEAPNSIKYTYALPSGSDISSIPTSWRSAIANATSPWESATGNAVAISESTSSTLKNRIYRTNLGSLVGETLRADYDGDDIIDGFHVRYNSGYSYYTDGKQYDVETTALHEWGHVLGLDHVFSYTSHVMYDGYTGVKRLLHSHDIEGINAMYSAN